MQKIYHKRNELLEVEFYQDEDCKIPFDFTNAKDLYIELKDGDITPFLELYPYTEFRNLYLPYFPNVATIDFLPSFENIYTLDDITLNLSKYIPEDNAVLFLSEDVCDKYERSFCNIARFSITENDDGFYKRCSESGNRIYYKKLTLFLPHGTKSELQKANEVAKELKEKYGVEEVNVFVLHCFTNIRVDIFRNIYTYSECLLYKNVKDDYTKEKELYYINKIITTNSIGLLKLQNNERLQVIDCFDIFNDAL